MMKAGIENVELIALNTDAQDLAKKMLIERSG